MADKTERPAEQGTHHSTARSARPGEPGRCATDRQGVVGVAARCGPGPPVYYRQDGDTLILLLCGGDKSTQHKDIEKAHELAEQWRADKLQEEGK